MTLESIVVAWLAPSGVAAVIAFIVWLIQHNVAIVALKKAEGKRDAEVNKLFEISRENAAVTSKTALILDTVERRLNKNEHHLEEHEKEAEGWRQRVVGLEERMKHSGG